MLLRVHWKLVESALNLKIEWIVLFSSINSLSVFGTLLLLSFMFVLSMIIVLLFSWAVERLLLLVLLPILGILALSLLLSLLSIIWLLPYQ